MNGVRDQIPHIPGMKTILLFLGFGNQLSKGKEKEPVWASEGESAAFIGCVGEGNGMMQKTFPALLP